jgi:proliferating cell nuclear antigen PCNA
MSFIIQIQSEGKAEIFSNIFKNIKNFTSDINIQVQEDKLYTQFLDTNHICLGELELSSEWFTSYECSEDVTLGINSELLTKILKCRGKNDTIEIVYDTNTNPDVLQISFQSEVNTTFTKNYELPLMEFDMDLIEIPKASQGQADIKMDTSMLSSLISELSSFGQDVSVKVNEEAIIMETKEDGGKCNINIDIEKIEMFSIDEDTELDLCYSLKYICMIMGFSKVSKKIYFTLGEQTPMMFQYSLDDESKNKDDNNETNNETDLKTESDTESETNTINYIRMFLAPKYND